VPDTQDRQNLDQAPGRAKTATMIEVFGARRPPVNRMGKTGGLPLRAVRRQCLDCCGGERKAVTWCTCDGLRSSKCELWLFRFGMNPQTFARRFGRRLVTPSMMPEPSVNLDDLPGGYAEASMGDCQET
jgi:hypothetical protein